MVINNRPTMLMILDGFGVSERYEGNTIAQANTPNFDALFSKYPGITILSSGVISFFATPNLNIFFSFFRKYPAKAGYLSHIKAL